MPNSVVKLWWICSAASVSLIFLISAMALTTCGMNAGVVSLSLKAGS